MEERVWICVYRDTIEEHNDNDNLAEILVERDFAEQYVKERKKEYFVDLEDFLAEYIADDTEDFYDYAKENYAIIKISMGYKED